MINVRINEEPTRLAPRITVIGVGGAGGNAVNNMIRSGLEGCEFLVCNTDHQALQQSTADKKIQLGTNTTQGLGAGARPDVGRAAAEESIEEIISHIEGSNMVFITCGMGGGTGTGAAPVIARAARDAGILTVGVATKPFQFEGTNRMRQAEEGLQELRQYVDTLIIIPNQNLFRIANEKTTFADAFKMADDVLLSGVRGVTDLMVVPGQINLDFSDVKSVMAEMGNAMMGTGEAEGEKRALQAAEAAISNPLIDDASLKGAKGVLINITGGQDLTLFEIDEAANRIKDEVDPDANIIFGSTFMDSMEGKMRVSVVATGIDRADAAGTGETTGSGTGGYKPLPNVGLNRPTMPTAPAVKKTEATGSTTIDIDTDVSGEEEVAVRDENTADMFAERTPAHTGQQKQRSFAGATRAPGNVGYRGNTSYTTGSNLPQGEASPVTKAQRVQGSFIPPKPAVPETNYQESPVQQGQMTLDEQPARTNVAVKRQEAPRPTAPQQPQTNTPYGSAGQQPQQSTRTTPAQQPKKSQSLFERLAESVRSRATRFEENADDVERNRVQPSLGDAQKTLGIDSDKEDTDLDIPAFLRRQAN